MQQFYDNLYDLSTCGLDEYLGALEELHLPLVRPSRLARYWPSALLGMVVFGVGRRFLSLNRQLLLSTITDAVVIVRHYVSEWLLKPLHQMYSTIRHDRRQLAVMDASALRLDVEVRASFLLVVMCVLSSL